MILQLICNSIISPFVYVQQDQYCCHLLAHRLPAPHMTLCKIITKLFLTTEAQPCCWLEIKWYLKPTLKYTICRPYRGALYIKLQHTHSASITNIHLHRLLKRTVNSKEITSEGLHTFTFHTGILNMTEKQETLYTCWGGRVA